MINQKAIEAWPPVIIGTLIYSDALGKLYAIYSNGDRILVNEQTLCWLASIPATWLVLWINARWFKKMQSQRMEEKNQ